MNGDKPRQMAARRNKILRRRCRAAAGASPCGTFWLCVFKAKILASALGTFNAQHFSFTDGWPGEKRISIFFGFGIVPGMNETTSLDQRVAALEQAAKAPPRPCRCWGVAAMALVGVLVTWNVWVLHQGRLANLRATVEHHFWVVGHENLPARDRAESFMSLVEAGNVEWKGAHLDGLQLAGVRLGHTMLQWADLHNCDLSRAVFAKAKLYKAKLQQSDLTEADFDEAELASADLYRAQMKGVQMHAANLRGAMLEQADASNGLFVGAQMADGYLLMVNMTGANLSAADLSNANLEAAILKGANLHLTRLSGANLKDADLTDANWWRARGLTTEQVATFTQKFPPSSHAPAALVKDFADWQKSAKPTEQ